MWKSKCSGARTAWDWILASTLNMTLEKPHDLSKSVFSAVEQGPYLMERENGWNEPLELKNLADSRHFRLPHHAGLPPSSLCSVPTPDCLHLSCCAHTSPAHFLIIPSFFLLLSDAIWTLLLSSARQEPFHLYRRYLGWDWIMESKRQQWGSKSQDCKEGFIFYHVTMTDI